MKQADRLKELRFKRKLTLIEVANSTGVSKSALSRMENGETKGTVDALLALANLYNVSVDYITCNHQRSVLIDTLIENLVQEGIVDLNQPLTPEVKKIIEDAVKLKISKMKNKDSH